MDPSEVDAIVERLIANPHDEEALSYAHYAGSSDPRAYAMLLERVGRETPDAAYASHWLSESANVWSMTLGDVHHAADVLLLAVVKDPTQDLAATRLADLYRENGDVKGLVALHEKRAKLIAPLADQDPSYAVRLAVLHEELGTLWSEPPLSQPMQSIEHFRRAIHYDPNAVLSIYSLRELLKAHQRYAEALPLFDMELATAPDTERQIALYRDQADVARLAQDFVFLINALRSLRAFAPEDPALMQEQATAILEAMRFGSALGAHEIAEGAQLYVALAELYPDQYSYGYSYAIAALELDPTNDRAVQLVTYYGELLGYSSELWPWWQRYLAANPAGVMAAEISAKLAEVPASALAAAGVGANDAKGEASGAALSGQPSSQDSGDFVEQPLALLSPITQPSGAGDLPAPETESQAHVSIAPERLAQMLDDAAALVAKHKSRDALAAYMEVLRYDPVSPEALSWVDEHLRAKRSFSDLRDVYQAASRAPGLASDERYKYLLKVASISEQQLRDVDGAVQALKQAAQIEPAARDQLRHLLEKGNRWDEVATLIEQEFTDVADEEVQIALLRKLATIHEQKRKDSVAAGESWTRLAALMPGDESPVLKAVDLLQNGERYDLAAEAITNQIGTFEDAHTRYSMLLKLGELREKLSDFSGAGDAYESAGKIEDEDEAWERAQRCFASAQRWHDASVAAQRRAERAASSQDKAALLLQAADYLFTVDEGADAIDRLIEASQLIPEDDALAEKLEQRLTEAQRFDDLVVWMLDRAAQVPDQDKRTALRKRVATVQREQLLDDDAARETWLMIVAEVEDTEALRWLAEDAKQRADAEHEAALLLRLVASLPEPSDKLPVQLQAAAILAKDLQDATAAIDAYNTVLKELDDKNLTAVQALAELYGRLDDASGEIAIREKWLALTDDPETRSDVGRRLADLYLDVLHDDEGAIRSLEVVYEADLDDLNAIERLVTLYEKKENWQRTAELLTVLVETEGDPDEAAVLALRQAEILKDRLDRGGDALHVLETLANEGVQVCRDAYVRIGDELGFKGVVATKLRDWYSVATGPERDEAFLGAFTRFLEMDRKEDALQVGVELIRSQAASDETMHQIEQLAVGMKDLDTLGFVHDSQVRHLTGMERADELIRQAEVMVQAGLGAAEAVQHGEQALSSVSPMSAEPLLERLSAMAVSPEVIVDLYEHQVGRCKDPADRLAALSRAAQVAAQHGLLERAEQMFDIALSAGTKDDILDALENAALVGDEQTGSKKLRSALASRLASGVHGARDGGRTRGALLRRAAIIAQRDLQDVDLAFRWLGEALVSHVDGESLDALENLGEQVNNLGRVETVLNAALEQVFDGPLVRQLLQRRAQLRRDRLSDFAGAAADLRRLHDLMPNDKEVSDELHSLLVKLGDWRSVVQLLEDQILRGKDPAVRAELARTAAVMWEERLADAREAADAWRRVLRMKPGDIEATEGLERAKANRLKIPLSMMPPPNRDDDDQVEASPSFPKHDPPVVNLARDAVPSQTHVASDDASDSVDTSADTSADSTQQALPLSQDLPEELDAQGTQEAASHDSLAGNDGAVADYATVPLTENLPEVASNVEQAGVDTPRQPYTDSDLASLVQQSDNQFSETQTLEDSYDKTLVDSPTDDGLTPLYQDPYDPAFGGAEGADGYQVASLSPMPPASDSAHVPQHAALHDTQDDAPVSDSLPAYAPYDYHQTSDVLNYPDGRDDAEEVEDVDEDDLIMESDDTDSDQ